MPPSQRIIIAGGGIAGLSAALALADTGYHVAIYEKVPTLQEVGAGIQLGPNATRLLHRLGVLEALVAHSFAPDFIHLKDGSSGKTLTSLPVAHFAEHHWHAPYLTLHRADLVKALLQAVLASPLISLHYGHEVNAVSGTLATGFEIEIACEAKTVKRQADLFIACDGVWSTLRLALPSREKARFSGFIAWRKTVARADLPASFLDLEKIDNVQVFMGTNGHFIAYPIRGGAAFNFVAITRGKRVGEKRFSHHFNGWAVPLRDVIAQKNWTYWPLFTMKVSRFLGPKGEIFLGDSAHATTPFAAQGAALAIEDAVSLASALSNEAITLDQALHNFARARGKRVKQVNQRGNFNRFVYHANGPIAFARNMVMLCRDPKKFLTELDWLYDHDARE